ncbi:tRNA splicing endonuclease subunit 34 [Brevipalpus obovatus]|uniref:tRNA splicing endonuclease subunit 34 n=1 Tax=Brevipalpus obovatus TaxID=246614 RepID=UPI003D9F2381
MDCRPSTSTAHRFILHYNNGSILVWDAADALNLRKDHRILGQLIGPFPGSSSQVNENGLPLSLMKEEARLLIDKNMADLVEFDSTVQSDSVEIFRQHTQKVKIEAQEAARQKRAQELETRIKDIVVKRSKRLEGRESEMESIDENSLIKEKLDIFEASNKNVFPVQIFTKSPWNHDGAIINNSWLYPSNKRERIKYNTFKDLYGKGYYIMSGLRFGCDYLVYESDPLVMHARYMVLCKDPRDDLTALQLISLSRTSVQVNKQLMIAITSDEIDQDATCMDQAQQESSCVYLSFQWRGNQDSLFKRTLLKL